MLTVQSQNRTSNSEDNESRFLNALDRSLEILIEFVQEVRNRPGPPTYPMAEIFSTTTFTDAERTVFTQQFNYKRNDREFSYYAPVFIDLQGVDVADAHLTQSTTEEDPTTETSGRLTQISTLLYKPAVMAISGLGSIINLLNFIPGSKVNSIIPNVAKVLPLPLRVLTVAASVIYFVPPLFAKLKKRTLKLFDEILADINNGNYFEAKAKLDNLSYVNRVLVHGGLPFTQNLRWSYYYLKGLNIENRFGSSEGGYEASLIFAETSEEKFLSLRGMINSYERRLQIAEAEAQRLEHMPANNYDRVSNERLIPYYKSQIALYLPQLPVCPEKRLEYAIDLNAQLEECIADMNVSDPNSINIGIGKFLKIKLDGYSKHTFPAATALYYQLLVRVIQLTGCHRVPCYPPMILIDDEEFELYRVEKMDVNEALALAQKYMEITLRHLQNHFPDKARQYRVYLLRFEQTKRDMDRAYEPVAPTMLNAARLPGLAVTVEVGNTQNTTLDPNDVQTRRNTYQVG